MKRINSLLFDDALNLKQVDIVIEKLDTEWGYCLQEMEDLFPVIGISDRFPTATDCATTLAHEMVHLYQIQILNREPDHGKTFTKFKSSAKDAGYEL